MNEVFKDYKGKQKESGDFMKLTNEQKNIINLVMKGRKNIDIAEEMGYSPATVKKRLSALYKKFYVTGRTELIYKVLCDKIV